MIKQSVYSSVLAAKLASNFLSEGGLLTLTGAKAALDGGTPGKMRAPVSVLFYLPTGLSWPPPVKRLIRQHYSGTLFENKNNGNLIELLSPPF